MPPDPLCTGVSPYRYEKVGNILRFGYELERYKRTVSNELKKSDQKEIQGKMIRVYRNIEISLFNYTDS